MNKKSQSGFAHLVVVTVILGLTVAGLLGFVYYQNFIQKKDNVVKKDDSSKTANDDTKTSTDNNIDNKDANEGYLVLDDWGVKFKLPTNLGDNKISYSKSDDSNYDTYYFSTERVKALGGLCADGEYTAISRMTELSDQLASPPELAAKFGNYYYYVSGPQDVCSNNSKDMQIQDSSMLKDFLMSVEKG